MVYTQLFKNKVAVLATMHQKEKVIAPILEQELGLAVYVTQNFNTDTIGTFTPEVPRQGSQLEAARLKAQKALEITGAAIAIASEGAFFPHPQIPFLPCNKEIVLLLDREQELEIIGQELSTNTNHNALVVSNIEQAYDFAIKVGFPEHGLIIMPNQPSPAKKQIFKGITTKEQLLAAVNFAIANSADGKAHIETDMRALYNPTRMKNIEKATLDLINNINQLCPQCSTPGFSLVEARKGLLCAYCQLPTQLISSVIYQCQKCTFRQEKLFPNGIEYAEPGQCSFCNP